MEAKSAADSRITMAQVVLPYHANAAGNMHGGELMKLMDSAAGVVAQRHCLCNVVTVTVDKLVFKEPILVGDLVICDAELIYVGRTSMEIYITVSVENLTLGQIKPALEGYFVMIALDRNGRPTPIPPLQIETTEQQQRFDQARARLHRG
ncbi:MAG: acyl-CoA thioesterase [Firmicutes bacterium]|nr:acyl-CoA thioesterase [Bacillota bacterium]